MVKAGVGYSLNNDSFNAGVKATTQAMRSAKISNVSFIIAFCSNKVDHEKFYRGIRSVVGKNTKIIGGSAVGVITNDHLSYTKNSAAVACFESGSLVVNTKCVNDLKKDEYLAGCKLGEIESDISKSKLVLLFYDSIKYCAAPGSPPVLNASLKILNGFADTFKSSLPIFGAGLVGDYGFGQVKQFCNDSVSDDCAVIALLSGKIEAYSTIMHGCTPKDGIYHTITKMNGQFVYEADNKPIVELINDAYGNEEWQNQNPVGTLTIGVNHGEKYGSYSERDYVNRLITGVLPDKSGIVLFEPDLKEGTEFQFMLRDSVRTIDTTRIETEKLVTQIIKDNKKPVFALYIDCAGRTAKFSNNLREEASEVQDILNEYKIPLLGFYSGVEIAPFIGKSRGLDWTGVLLILTENID